jgi:type IV pilus assembly protein PilB
MEVTKSNRFKMLGERLLDAGLISQGQLSLALSEQKRRGGFLGEVLEALNFVTQEELAKFLASETNATYVDLSAEEVNSELLDLVPQSFAQKYQLIPLRSALGVLTVAMADTFDVVAVDALEKLTGMRIDVVAAPVQAIHEAIEQKYIQVDSFDQLIEKAVSGGIRDMGEDEAGNLAPLVKLVDQILMNASRKRATDIHIEPEESMIRVRVRIDGELHQELLIPKILQAGVESRIKIMAGLDVTERRLPQDGRISFSIGRKSLDLRVSTLPTQFGESIVLRLLDKTAIVLELGKLGMESREKETLLQAIHKPHGIVLVTGPTGSGKTTTLYAALGQMDSYHRSIFTLEDPIEYQFQMIRQTQINTDIGMSFASGLRSLLRQDPDVILVGEIRDEETAQLATRAALTGHLVLSTLHTNSAAGAIPRLINMGVEPYLLSGALAGVFAQRLVRRICSYCSAPFSEAATHLSRVGISLQQVEQLVAKNGANDSNAPLQFLKGTGCSHCFNTGYSGRVAIYESLYIDDDLANLIRTGVTETEIRNHANLLGRPTMLQEGLRKAAAGLASLEDVLRVVG